MEQAIVLYSFSHKVFLGRTGFFLFFGRRLYGTFILSSSYKVFLGRTGFFLFFGRRLYGTGDIFIFSSSYKVFLGRTGFFLTRVIKLFGVNGYRLVLVRIQTGWELV